MGQRGVIVVGVGVLCILDGVTAVDFLYFFYIFAGPRRSLRLTMSDAKASNTSGS